MAGIALYKQKHLWMVELNNVLKTFCKSVFTSRRTNDRASAIHRRGSDTTKVAKNSLLRV
jgi:hypothetical protein